jgi:hypothetical protein
LYHKAKSRYPDYPYAEALQKDDLNHILAPYIYNIVENTIHFRFKNSGKVYKGVVTIPKQIQDPSAYYSVDKRASMYMRIDGNFQQKLSGLGGTMAVYPGDWFWYNE